MTKIYLAKHSVPNSSYPAVTSSFFVDSVFDMPVGLLVLLFAITQGAIPSLDVLPSLPAFDLAFWADHPRFALFTITAVVVGLLVLYAVLSIRAVVFWRRVRQGVVILTDFRRYLRQVASWMAVGWLLRFACVLVLPRGVQHRRLRPERAVHDGRAGGLDPDAVHPGGAGAQQALLVYAFRDVAPRSTVLAYSVGQQIAIAAFNVGVAMVALFLMLRTFDIRGVVGAGGARGREARRRGPT